MTRLPVPDKFTDEHGNRWRLLAGPFERPREDGAWQSAIDSLAAGRINSYPWLHEDGRFYLYRDARGWKEWEGRRTALFRSVRACAVALLAVVSLAGCGRPDSPRPLAPVHEADGSAGQWVATAAGDARAVTVQNVGDTVTMEVRKYPKKLGTYAVANVDARAVRVEAIGDPTRTCAFVTRDASWTVREYVDGRTLVNRASSAATVWVVVEAGTVKASVLP